MELYDVKINGRTNPIGFEPNLPMVSWKVRDAKGTKPKNTEVVVSKFSKMEPVLFRKEGADLDSRGESLKFTLEPYTRYYVRVQVEDETGDLGESEPVWFETGKMQEPWQAKWIGTGENDCPELRKTFSLSKPVKSARLYICGLGLFKAWLNGQEVGNDFLAPFLNDYEKQFQYCTYDVTEALTDENELNVFLGNGWYRGRFGLCSLRHPERPFALLAEMRIVYTDGIVSTIATDTTWQFRRSPYVENSIYDGETQDWTLPAEAWRPVISVSISKPVTARYSLPLHVMEQFPVKEVIHTPAGETVLDFGQEFAGIVKIRQTVPKGSELKLEFGEILQDGCFYHANYRTAKSEFLYRSDGKPREIVPQFTYFGFRFVKVSGLDTVDPKQFTGCALYSEMEQTGFLKTGNAKINRLILNALWGAKSNFVDLPTDCPQRDERLGWTGDAQVFCRTAGYLLDTRAFYEKFARDLHSDQKRNDGKVSIYLPNEFPGLYASVWSDIGTFLPHMLYEYYGDRELLASEYPMMRDWVEFLLAEDEKRGGRHLYDWGFQFGDWLALDGPTEQSRFGRTDNYYVSSIYYYASVCYTMQAAGVLNRPEEAEKYRRLAEQIKAAILEEYFTASGRLSVDTQTGYILALRFGIYRDRERMIRDFRERVRKDCTLITGGFVGATMMNQVLMENGMEDLAYEFLFYEGFPGWLYEVNLGATTIWERWNSVLPDGHMSGTSMNSLNHYSYGSVVESLYSGSAGIHALSPGFRSARIAPKPDARLGGVNCTFSSASGDYVSNWTILEDGRLSFDIEIPFGCTAVIELPEQQPMEKGAGSYHFVIQTERDYRAVYNEKTPVRTLLTDERCKAILEKELPDFLAETLAGDKEAKSKCLAENLYKAKLFRLPTDRLESAIEQIKCLDWKGENK